MHARWQPTDWLADWQAAGKLSGTKQKKGCTTCLSCGFLTPEPLTYKLHMVFNGTERCPDLESKYKNTVQLLKKTCLRKGKTEITEGFEKYKECPEPDVFVHKMLKLN